MIRVKSGMKFRVQLKEVADIEEKEKKTK